MPSCKVSFTNTNWDRYSVESPKTGVKLYVSGGWADAETDVFHKIRTAVAAAQEKDWLAHQAYVDLTIDELRHFKARADKQAEDQRSRRK